LRDGELGHTLGLGRPGSHEALLEPLELLDGSLGGRLDGVSRTADQLGHRLEQRVPGPAALATP
jgi:hypothetical protein